MSDALNYLLEVRKNAMGPYFEFMKEGGKHLDRKTRSLLSVITKVDSQTEAGFKQYLKRALQAGNQADEILDAMLVCMPTLGLSKIIWAIDIIQKMELSEFKPENLGKKKQWIKLIPLNELNEGISCLGYDNRFCYINKREQEICIYDNQCPHQATEIPVSALNETVLTCPKHNWKFDLETGDCIEVGNRPLNQIKFKLEDNHIYIYN